MWCAHIHGKTKERAGSDVVAQQAAHHWMIFKRLLFVGGQPLVSGLPYYYTFPMLVVPVSRADMLVHVLSNMLMHPPMAFLCVTLPCYH